MKVYVKVMSGMKVTIPKEIMQKHGISVGDVVKIKDLNDMIMVVPMVEKEDER